MLPCTMARAAFLSARAAAPAMDGRGLNKLRTLDTDTQRKVKREREGERGKRERYQEVTRERDKPTHKESPTHATAASWCDNLHPLPRAHQDTTHCAASRTPIPAGYNTMSGTAQAAVRIAT